MEDERIAAIGVDEAVFGAPRQPRDGRAGHALPQVDGNRLAQVRTARLDRGQALAEEHGFEPAHGGFDFGKFWHVFQLGCVCPRHKAPLEHGA